VSSGLALRRWLPFNDFMPSSPSRSLNSRIAPIVELMVAGELSLTGLSAYLYGSAY
jgi:hypothetical protein